MEKFCINTLSDGRPGRVTLLEKTIHLFFENCSLSNFDWFILINKSTEDFKILETQLKEKYSNRVNFYFTHLDKNLGVGGGINYLNNQSKNYEYTLFIEGDWYHVPEKASKIPSNWIDICLDYLDKRTDVDQITLRKFIDDYDDRQFGYGRWIAPRNVAEVELYYGLNFLHLIQRDYTNNPIIRRNSSFYKAEIFPLDEFFDEDGNSLEVKGNSEWGQAEIKAFSKGNQLKTLFLGFGVFIHGDSYRYQDFEPTGCGDCKYGLLKPNKIWCALCQNDTDFSYFEKHQWECEHWHRLVHQKDLTDNERLAIARDLVKNHKLSLEELEQFFGK